MMEIDIGKQACRQWAEQFDLAHNRLRDHHELKLLWSAYREQPINGNETENLPRVIARLDFAHFVATLVHYSSAEKSRVKVRDAERLAGTFISGRDYWNKLDRAHHLLAGYMLARSNS